MKKRVGIIIDTLRVSKQVHDLIALSRDSENYEITTLIINNEYSKLDSICWEEHQKYDEFKGWAPYKRGSKTMLSYGPTPFCLVNLPETKEKHELLDKITGKINRFVKLKKLLGVIASLLPNQVKKNRLIASFSANIRGL